MATQPPPSYYGSIPAIATAYQNDPRNKLNQSMLAQATAGNPVAQGGWGVPDGLAHVAQAIAASLGQKAQDKKYAAREHGYIDALKQSIDPGMSASAPAVQPGPTDASQAVASALSAPPPTPGAGAPMPTPGMAPPPVPGNGPPSAIQPPPAMMAPQGPPAGAGGLPSGAMPPPGMSPGGMGHPPSGMIPGGAMSGGPATASIGDLNAPPGVPPTGFTEGQQGARTNLAHAPAYTGEQIEQRVLAAIPGTTVGSRQRTREQQAVLYQKYQNYIHNGGPFAPVAAPPGHSDHEKDLARDFNPPPGMPLRQFAAAVNQAVPGAFVLTRGEGGHAHVASRPGAPVAASSPDTRQIPGGTPIQVAHNEAVPDALQMPNVRPDAPAIPDAVKSQRMAIARRMLDSNNPDLVAMAQSYLDKGLTEDHDAEVTQNEQQFQRGNLGYTSDLSDFNAARDSARSQRVADRTAAQSRNFQSSERVAGETFTGGQNAAQRAQERDMNTYNQMQENARLATSQAGENSRLATSEAGALKRTQLTIDGKHEDAATKREARMSMWAQTPTGSAQIAKMNDEIGKNEDTIGQLRQFSALNARNATGGNLIGQSQTARNLQGGGNADISTMNSIASKATLAALGGSLGVAISDGDRNFISGSSISTTKPKEANDRIIAVVTGALQRQNEYKQHYMDSQLSGNYADFQRQWNQYRNSVPLILQSGQANPSPLTFDEWKAYQATHGAARK